MTAHESSRREDLIVVGLVCLVFGVYLAGRVASGWNPHDEGLLAQTAERVLGGELPHRDFDDAYTGGLAIYHATVFRLLGTSLLSLRIALVAAYIGWLPIVYYLARRFARPLPAALVTAIIAVWTVPNRAAAMPSWYNLFLATAGAAVICRYITTRHRRWLFVAGVAGGLSVLVKLVGLYYIAGAMLALVWDDPPPARERAGRGLSIAITVGLVAFVAALSHLVSRLPGVSPQWHFVAPSAALVALLLWREWHSPPAPGRAAALVRDLLPFAAGVAMPVALFLVPYIASGAVGALVHGALIAPGQRFEYAMALPQSLRSLWMILPWVCILALPLPLAASVAAAVALIVVLMATVSGGPIYGDVWASARHIAPVVVLAGVAWLAPRIDARDARTRALWVVLCMAALTGLVQFPYAGSHYFSYFVAFPILALLALVTRRAEGPRAVPALVGAFWFAFAVRGTNRDRYRINGDARSAGQVPSVALAIPRTGLVVGADEAALYQRLVVTVQAHSPAGSAMYAGPDLPEMYFLTQRRNPTRILYDFLDAPVDHDARVLRAIDSAAVPVTVTGGYPGGFSPPIDSALAAGLRSRFPHSTAMGPYLVRWRDRPRS